MTISNQTNETTLKRGLLTVAFIAAAVMISFQAVRQNNPLLIMAIFLFPVAVWMIGNPSALLVALFLTTAAKLALPGLPGGLTFSHLLQLTIIGWSIVYTALSGIKSKGRDPVSTIFFLFLLNMLLIIFVRGTGMSITGGATYGGGGYIRMAISLLFYSAATKIHLTEKQIRLILFGMLICSTVPLLAQWSIKATGGATGFLSNFISMSSSDVAEGSYLAKEDALVRWNTGGLNTTLMMAALVVPAIRKRTLLSWGLIAVAVYLNLMSGFRGRMIGQGVILFVWLVYDSKNRQATFFKLAALGVLGWVVVLVILPVLPLAAQRALSFLPFVSEHITDPSVARTAQGSIDFRVDIWDMAWKEVPKYLLIGRGFSEDITQFAWLQRYWYQSVEFFYYMHNYHSGPLSLLLDFGLAGLFLGVAFMWKVSRNAWTGVRRFCAGRNDFISKYYAFLTIQFTYMCISFFLIFGDVREGFPTLILMAVQLYILKRFFLEQSEQVAVEAVQGLGGLRPR
jgi:hypothetical protein